MKEHKKYIEQLVKEILKYGKIIRQSSSYEYTVSYSNLLLHFREKADKYAGKGWELYYGTDRFRTKIADKESNKFRMFVSEIDMYIIRGQQYKIQNEIDDIEKEIARLKKRAATLNYILETNELGIL